MAIGKLDMSIPEMEELLKLVGKRDKHKEPELFRAARELKRGLERAQQSDREDKARMAKQRAMRRVPGFDEEPLDTLSSRRRGIL